MATRTTSNPGLQATKGKARSKTIAAPAPTWHQGNDFEIPAEKFLDRMKIDLSESTGKGKNKVARKVNVCGWVAVNYIKYDRLCVRGHR